MKLVDKHIVITGAASGLGLELLHQLQPNNRISVIARPSRGLDALRHALPGVDIYEADLSDMSSVERAADALIGSRIAIDVLINNAAVQHTPRFTDPDFRYETIRREIDVNFTSICTLVHLLLPSLMRSEAGMIVNINSGLALAPKTGSAVYCATKAAVNIFSQSLAYQMEDTNVAVRQVFLPLVDTAMTRGRGSGKLPPDRVAAAIIAGLGSRRTNIDIGKAKLLRVLLRVAPSLAAKIMKRG
ncbi:MAG: SDR family oxidoreductase [Hoeflea sp.]|uniref:SDR family oxidoreductase n=1 Tax=Hoeflea sp. TaxID=1940281 RepID=UPI003EF9AAAD